MTFFEYLKAFTQTYKAYQNEDKGLREAMCLSVMAQYEFLPLQEDDLIAGRLRILPVGYLNEPLLGRSVSWFYDEPRAMEALEKEGATPDMVAEAKEMLSFWKEQETRKKIRARFPREMQEAMPENIYWEHSQISFPLYRVIGAYMDYPTLLSLGLGGMKEKVRTLREKASSAGETTAFYEACLIALDVLSDVCRRYAGDAFSRGDQKLGKALFAITEAAPATFLEAMQLSWLYSLISGVLNYGRMDDYLGDYLVHDLQAGTLTREEALAYTCSLWRLIDARKTVFHGRVIIGGKGRHHEANANEFAMIAMEASRLTAEAEPQLSLRFYEGQDERLFQKAMEVIGEGKIYPLLYNDDVNIPSVEKSLRVPPEEAEQYCFFGCGEYVINKKSMGSPNGIINLLKALEATLFNGTDLYDGKKIGLDLGALPDYATFDDLMAAYQKQVSYQMRLLAQQEQLEYDVCSEEGDFLFISMLMDQCLERNKPLLSGGVQYLGGTLETYGNINTTNSLYAIKTVVYEQKKISRERLLDALRADFQGYAYEQKLLEDAEKYGNDEPGVDQFAAKLHDFICLTAARMGEETNLYTYRIVMINNEANTILGRFTGASADGRKAGQPMANANNPAGGTDHNGVTAMMNSLVKLRTDIHAGAVQNLTFSKDLFNTHRETAEQLLKTYFHNGGQQAMINVLHRGELEDAMKHPEKHQSLMVRVGGFSARFVTLSPDVQQEIASRTLY